jgi:hypothetical protein
LWKTTAVTGMSWRTQVMISLMLMPQAPSPAYEIAGRCIAAVLAPIIVGSA